MNFVEVLDNLIPSDFIPKKDDYFRMYRDALDYLNIIKCSRFKAMYFGSLQIGPDVYNWVDSKGDKDFTEKYQSCCIFIMNDLYNRLKDKKQELVEISLCILYSMLALYVDRKNIKLDKITMDLLAENDKYVQDGELNSEFGKDVNNG